MELIDSIILKAIVPAFANAWEYIMLVLSHGGWVLVLGLLLYILFDLRREKKYAEYLDNVEWVYLNVTIPEINSPSIMSAENVFNNLHGTYKNYDWRETNLLGMKQTWLSFEIVSIGGLVRFIIRAPKTHVQTVKSSIFGQYTDAEITEAGDYAEALVTPYNSEGMEYDFWGAELELQKEDAYPIKTYQLFEHRAAEMIHDPLSNMLELMSELDSDEIIAVQVLIQPSDDHWKGEATEIAEKLKKDEKKEGEERPASSKLSESERNVINSIHIKLSKLSFETKIRFLYAAPKGKLNTGVRLPEMIGAFSQFNTYDMNGFKVNSYTKTSVGAKYSEKFEKKKMSSKLLWKKRAFIENFKERNFKEGAESFHLSTEELASIYHFPLEVVRTGAVSRTEARTGEPPINLPM